mmetsp:Transcript_106971/g.149084  ORF Transcript_106971/g.149084 Transcript_106971/m.149084 type:complete len:426 (+) Transcript_106971:744-2021(+)
MTVPIRRERLLRDGVILLDHAEHVELPRRVSHPKLHGCEEALDKVCVARARPLHRDHSRDLCAGVPEAAPEQEGAHDAQRSALGVARRHHWDVGRVSRHCPDSVAHGLLLRRLAEFAQLGMVMVSACIVVSIDKEQRLVADAVHRQSFGMALVVASRRIDQGSRELCPHVHRPLVVPGLAGNLRVAGSNFGNEAPARHRAAPLKSVERAEGCCAPKGHQDAVLHVQRPSVVVAPGSVVAMDDGDLCPDHDGLQPPELGENDLCRSRVDGMAPVRPARCTHKAGHRDWFAPNHRIAQERRLGSVGPDLAPAPVSASDDPAGEHRAARNDGGKGSEAEAHLLFRRLQVSKLGLDGLPGIPGNDVRRPSDGRGRRKKRGPLVPIRGERGGDALDGVHGARGIQDPGRHRPLILVVACGENAVWAVAHA